MDGGVDIEPEFLKGKLRGSVKGVFKLGKKRLIVLCNCVKDRPRVGRIDSPSTCLGWQRITRD